MERPDETIADIIAEKRRQAEAIERDCAEKMKRGEMVSDCYARELVADIRREADRLDAAHKREMDELKKQLPNPDPDWEEICAKCSNGEVEPDCEYYGEPCGCNSPIYQHYPNKQMGNAAKLREALMWLREIVNDWNASNEPIQYCQYSAAIDKIDSALAAPPRNCDLYQTERDARNAWFNNEVLPRVRAVTTGIEPPFTDWLFIVTQGSEAKSVLS